MIREVMLNKNVTGALNPLAGEFFCYLSGGTEIIYRMDTTTPISSLPRHCRLLSAMVTEYDVPHTRTKFGDRAFSVAGPHEWNALPADIRNITDLLLFKRAIKTLFHIRNKQFCFSQLYLFGTSG